MSPRLAKADKTISRFHVTMPDAHTIVAQSCLGALLHLDENALDDLENFPLARYAAEHWVGHARFDESVSSNVHGGMKRLFDPNRGHFSTWASIYHIKHPHSLSGKLSLIFPLGVRATPLQYAAVFGVPEVVGFLIIERSQDVDAVIGVDKWTPLLLTSQRGHVEVAQLLLKRGADKEARDYKSRTPLLLASQRGHVEVAQLLLKHGADTEARDYKSRTSLLLATELGNLEVTRLLLNHGADKEARDDRNRTPLLLASQHGHAELTRVLLKHGTDKHARTYTRHTPLHLASQRGHLEVARVLLEHGADREARDNYEYTPLLLASERGHVGVVQILLKHGVDMEARNLHFERTPLLLASRHGHVEVARILLEHGADREALDGYGRAPSHLASRNRHVEITQVLREHGVNIGGQGGTGSQPLEIISTHQPVEYSPVEWVPPEHDTDVKEDRDSINGPQEKEVSKFLKHCAAENEDSDVTDPTLLDQAPEHREHENVGAARVLLEYSVDEGKEDTNEMPLNSLNWENGARCS